MYSRISRPVIGSKTRALLADRGKAILLGEANDHVLLVQAGEQIPTNGRSRIPEHFTALDAGIARERGIQQSDQVIRRFSPHRRCSLLGHDRYSSIRPPSALLKHAQD